VCSLAGIRDVLGEGHVSGASLEGAIAAVEDLIMPILREVPAGTQLHAGGPSVATAPNEGVEHLFNDLADHATGSVIAWTHREDPDALALALLIVREVMHHGGFRHVARLADGEES